MATQAQKDASAKRRKEAEAKKNAAQKILRTGKNADGTTASQAQRDAAIKRRDGHILTMKSAEDVMEGAATKAITATHDLARVGRQEAKAEQEYTKLVHGAGSPEHLAAIKKVEEAAKYIHAQVAAADLSHDDAKTKRETLEKQTVGKSGQELIDLQTQIRAYGDRMRLLTGRQKGEGTSYIGPGLRVAMELDGKTIKRDDQGRVVYDVDTDEYTDRFIAPFKPTAEQIKMGEKLFPGVGITEGYLTPWQQVNIQWMTGSKNEKGKLLDDMGITATDENINLFGTSLKEGKVPKAWRDTWRTEKWGDVQDTDPNSPTYGLWTPATGDKRQAAIDAQRKRYEAGYFNPTTGKGGVDKGAPSDWGPNTGTISPDDHVPPGWKPTGPVPDLNITGDPNWVPKGGNNLSGAEGSMGLLKYRPWTQKYWDTYVPEKAHGLLEMGPTQREYSMSYLPGEFRDPATWAKWADNHKGHIPEGGWIRNKSNWPSAKSMGLTPGAMPFTSPAQASNIYANPWSAKQMNLTPAQGAQWQGFLSNIGNTPLIDASPTSLLGGSDSAAVPYTRNTIIN